MSDRVLCDNDIILKLAAFDLLDRALHRLGLPPEAVLVRDATYHAIQSSRSLEQKYGIDVLTRARTFVQRVTRIRAEANRADIELMIRFDGVDQGEAELFSYAGAMPNALVMTGDKNSLRALAGAQELRLIYQRLEGRVICLEMLLQALIESEGFEIVRGLVAPHASCDKAVRVIFGSGLGAERQNVDRAIQSYLSELRAVVGERWLFRLDV